MVHGVAKSLTRLKQLSMHRASMGSSWPRDQARVSCLLHWQVGSLPLVPPGKPVPIWAVTKCYPVYSHNIKSVPSHFLCHYLFQSLIIFQVNCCHILLICFLVFSLSPFQSILLTVVSWLPNTSWIILSPLLKWPPTAYKIKSKIFKLYSLAVKNIGL